MSGITLGANSNGEKIELLYKMANRHGLIAGATGTGKTVTLKVLAEQFSKNGVPVFLTDVKGDLSGFINEGSEHPEVSRRTEAIGLDDFAFRKFPTAFWDLYGEYGHPVRTTLTEMGPVLLSELLELNDTQQDIISLAFKYADSNGMHLLDIKDMKAIISKLSDASEEELEEYGKIAKSSVGAIKRRLSALEASGGNEFFAEPALDIKDFIKTEFSGDGLINILDARKLMLDTRLYSTFLLWFLSELFEEMPEVGDMEKPKMVLFFDEAHLIFKNISKPLMQKIEMVVKLIRSKGVGVYFITQSPSDIPSEILSQLGNRIVHSLRAFTENDRKGVRAIANSFYENPSFKVEDELGLLETGESLVSCLDAKGAPQMVQRILNSPPLSKFGPASAEEVKSLIASSPYEGKYRNPIDRESAFEMLAVRKKEALEKGDVVKEEKKETKKKSSNRQSPFEAFFKSILRAFGSQIGRQLVRGILGSLKK